jgi:menaquinone-dependent protoporphyrinogen IX oxidase
MRVLVAFASKHGGTQGIAERIGEKLVVAGQQVDVLPAKQVGDLTSYGAFVIGSAAYMGSWHPGPCGYSAAARSAPRGRMPRVGTCF